MIRTGLALAALALVEGMAGNAAAREVRLADKGEAKCVIVAPATMTGSTAGRPLSSQYRLSNSDCARRNAGRTLSRNRA